MTHSPTNWDHPPFFLLGKFLLILQDPAHRTSRPCSLTISPHGTGKGLGAGNTTGIRVRQAWVQIPTLPFTSCVTHGKSLNLSGPQNPSAPLQSRRTILTAAQQILGDMALNDDRGQRGQGKFWGSCCRAGPEQLARKRGSHSRRRTAAGGTGCSWQG